MTNSYFPSDPSRHIVGVAFAVLVASASAAAAAFVGYHGLEHAALMLTVIVSAGLLVGLRRNPEQKTGADLQSLVDKITAVCEEVKNGNREARIPDNEAGPFTEVLLKMNDLIDCYCARVGEAEAGLDTVIKNITSVCHEVREGNFEARITNIEETGALAEAQNKVNNMIDCCDAFVREATASLDSVCRNIYYRRILSGGLQGSFRVAADMINSSIGTQEKAVGKARAEAAAQQAHIVDTLAEGLKNLADGNLTFRIGEFPEAYVQVRDDFNDAMARLQETIQAIAAAAREVSNATAEISVSTTDLSQRTEEQAASLEQTSAAMEQMLATVRKNAENAQQASGAAGSTRGVADRGGEIVTRAMDAMTLIEESSSRVSDIISVIDEIARQTNLLALNAAVEAARAGDAGRGFAVVATEVRSLAQRSAQAAKDVKDLITTSDSQVKNGVDLVKETGASLNEIVASIKGVADVINEIASASVEQATGIEQVNKALTQMDEVTQQNSALVEENAATARTLEEQAKMMDERVASFRVGEGEAHRKQVDQRPVASASAA